MDIFVTPGKNKTMVEFIPRYYEILAKEKGAKKVLISNGKFEKDAIEFVKSELKRLNY